MSIYDIYAYVFKTFFTNFPFVNCLRTKVNRNA